LNLDDLVKLSTHFNISLDNLILNIEDNIVFQFSALNSQPKSYSEYLQPIVQLTELLYHFPKEQFNLFYATNEIPIFHYYSFKEMNYFKYFMWAWTVWEFENTKMNSISFERPINSKDQFLNFTKKINEAYYQISSTEFISETALHNTTQQIKYFLSINKYESPEDALKMCQSLRDVVQHIMKMAEVGKKFLPGELPTENSPDYFLFHNEITQSNNIMVVETPGGNHTFATLDNPNLLRSQSEKISNYAKDWFYKQKKRSLALGKETEKNRFKFFKIMFDHIDKTEK